MKIMKEIVLPLLAQFAILLICIILATLAFNYLPKDFIMEPIEVGGEETLPWIARLIYMIFGSVMAGICLFVSSKTDTYRSFFSAFAAGVFLWQSAGECAYHFGFSRMEGTESMIYLAMFVVLLGIAYFRKLFPFHLWSFFISFLANWLGHFVMIGTYPLAPQGMAEETWYLLSGIIGGTLLLILPVYILAKHHTLKSNLIASECIFMALGVYAGAFGAF